MTACEECGDDAPAEGHRLCLECLERLGHAADAYPRGVEP